VCPFNATAIKSYTDIGDVSDKIQSSSSGGSFRHDSNGIFNQDPDVVEIKVNQCHDMDAHIEVLHQWKFNNGYYIYDDLFKNIKTVHWPRTS